MTYRDEGLLINEIDLKRIAIQLKEAGGMLMLHAEARGEEIVENIEDADTVFSIDEGITPFDVDIIVAEYIK